MPVSGSCAGCTPPCPLPVLALSNEAECGAVTALMAGASGHLFKPVAAKKIVEALAHVAVGEAVLCPGSQKGLVRALRGAGQSELTPRQKEVMSGLLRGQIDKEIAAQMGIGKATVHTQLEQIYRKLGVHDRKAAVRKYVGFSGL